MSDDANDVTKALAAFGAPSIRYHSFGQAQTRLSNIPAQRPAVVAPLASPVVGETEPVAGMTRQDEPVSAPEMLPPAGSVPRPMPAVASATRPAPLFPSSSTVAPPPRPLAEWAAPVTTAPVRPFDASTSSPPSLMPADGYPSAASPVVAPVPATRSAPPLVATVPLAAAGLVRASAPQPIPPSSSRPGVAQSPSSLADVFAFLAGS